MTQRPTDAARASETPRPPSLPRQAWNLARSLAQFVADGCRTIGEDDYRRRLEICDGCYARRGDRCLKCGCRLSMKARARALRCPLDKWPPVASGVCQGVCDVR